MRKQTRTIMAAILGVGAVLTVGILLGEPGGGQSGEASAEAGPPSYPKGPNGGRLLTEGPLQLEVTIYETGVPPQFRVYPFKEHLKALPPRDVDVRIELQRLGGRVDRIAFRPEATYLQGQNVVEEPHSFDVKVFATYDGRQYQWSYSQIEGKVQLGADQRASAGIVLDTVRPREMVTTLELPGEVKANETRRAHVVPRLQGVVTAVFKQEGDKVRKGEVIAMLNSRELADAKSAYLVAHRRVEFTRVTLQREETLWKKKISAERDYLEAQRAFDEAELSSQLAAQNLVVLGVSRGALPALATEPLERFAQLAIRAPLDGTVIKRNVTVGEVVPADETLFVVADLSSVWVDISVYATDLAAVHEGQQAMVVSTDLGLQVAGRVSFFGPLVGQESRAATARIVVPNSGGRWRPGLFVTVRLVRDATTVPLAVSAEAIQTFRDWQVVFVRHGDWFEARPLELGRTDGEWVEVLRGLAAGDQYASKNSFAVKAEIGKLGATHDH